MCGRFLVFLLEGYIQFPEGRVLGAVKILENECNMPPSGFDFTETKILISPKYVL